MDINPGYKELGIQNETSEDLLVILSMKEDSPEAALMAFHEFHSRFKHFVSARAYSISKDTPCPLEDLASSIMSNTFIKVYYNAGAFDSANFETSDTENAIKLWLVGIVKNEYRKLISQHFDKEKGDASRSYMKAVVKQGEVIIHDDLDNDPLEIPTIEKDCLAKGLAALSEREREVLLTYFRFQEGNKQLPKEELQDLAERFNTTSVNLRQIKVRAMKKLRTFAMKCTEENSK